MPANVAWLAGRPGMTVRCAVTRSGERFATPDALRAAGATQVLTEAEPTLSGSRAPHAELADWADAIIVMPATANAVAKVAHGIADGLVPATILAATVPVFLVPTMAPGMFRAAATQRNLRTLVDDGHHLVGLQSVEPNLLEAPAGLPGIEIVWTAMRAESAESGERTS